ncbi:DsbA family protein [Streptomyces sp. NPDC057555]|uniref:DsbA family protein n=1 Tax=Streptomyces sp. NPDC057555 TaxID=3346166 RepID=UPI00368CFCFB
MSRRRSKRWAWPCRQSPHRSLHTSRRRGRHRRARRGVAERRGGTCARSLHPATGAVFGPAFLTLLQQGDFVRDSHDAATGLAALRTQAPRKTLDFAHEISHAFYHDGMSLSDPTTCTTLATRHGLDPDMAAAALTDPAHREQAQAEFTRTRSLGITAFPTVLLDAGSGPRLLPVTASDRDPGHHLDTALAHTHTPR